MNLDQYKHAWKQIVAVNQLHCIDDDEITEVFRIIQKDDPRSKRFRILLHSSVYLLIIALCQGCLTH